MSETTEPTPAPEATQPLDGTVLSTIPAPGPKPTGMAFDGEFLWVADREDRKIHKLNPETGQILFTIAFDGDLTGTAWDGQYIWQADQSSRTISRINPETGQIDRAIKVEVTNGEIAGICHAKAAGDQPDGLWYSLFNLGQVRKVKTEDGSFMKAYPTHEGVAGIVPLRRHIYYSEPANGRIHKLHTLSGSLIISYVVGGQPMGLCHDGEAFWVGDQETNELRRIQL